MKNVFGLIQKDHMIPYNKDKKYTKQPQPLYD